MAVCQSQGLEGSSGLPCLCAAEVAVASTPTVCRPHWAARRPSWELEGADRTEARRPCGSPCLRKRTVPLSRAASWMVGMSQGLAGDVRERKPCQGRAAREGAEQEEAHPRAAGQPGPRLLANPGLSCWPTPASPADHAGAVGRGGEDQGSHSSTHRGLSADPQPLGDFATKNVGFVFCVCFTLR